MPLGEGSYCVTKEVPPNVTIGKHSSIAENCKFHCYGDHHCVENRKCVYTINWNQSKERKPIKIGNDVWICEGACILEGVIIGDGAIIGARAVIAKDVPPFAVVVGNPQVIKRYRFTKEQIKKLLEIKWWDWSKEDIDKARDDMEDIDKFIEKYYKE